MFGAGLADAPPGWAGGRSPGCRWWCLWLCIVLCCPFSHEMSWMRSGTELSHFLRLSLHTRSVRYELLLSMHVGHDKNRYMPVLGYSISTKLSINVRVRLSVRHKICHLNTRNH